MISIAKSCAVAGRAAALAFVAAAFLGGSGQAARAASIDITVTPWLAPNAFGSPSYAGAVANQIDALYQGLSSNGTPGTESP